MFNLENEIRKTIPNILNYFEVMKGMPSFTKQEEEQAKFTTEEKHIFETYTWVRKNTHATVTMRKAGIFNSQTFMTIAEEMLNGIRLTNEVKWAVMLLLNTYLGK
jgi:hypothetical protein